MNRYEAHLELEIATSLGEGPLWHVDEKCLYFVDILEKQVHRFNPKTGKPIFSRGKPYRKKHSYQQ